MKIKTSYKGLKQELKNVKADLNWKAVDICKHIGLSPSHLSCALSGHTQLSFNAIAKLSIILDIPISQLCEIERVD